MANDCDPLEIVDAPNLTETENEVVVAKGVVVNVNTSPVNEEAGMIEGAFVEETVKSDASPVVAPAAPETKIVHEIAPPTRAGVVAVVQLS